MRYPKREQLLLWNKQKEITHLRDNNNKKAHKPCTQAAKPCYQIQNNNKQYSQNLELSAKLAGASAESLNESSQHVFSILW